MKTNTGFTNLPCHLYTVISRGTNLYLMPVRTSDYHYSNSQKKHMLQEFVPFSVRALRRHLVKDIDGATSFIPIEWEISYSS